MSSSMKAFLDRVFQLTPSQRATRLRCEFGFWIGISTHALTEGDVPRSDVNFGKRDFNSRPHRGRLSNLLIKIVEIISTHALTEGDFHHILKTLTLNYFNSRPHRGRPSLHSSSSSHLSFQLTPSQRATIFFSILSIVNGISTHALTEGDGSLYLICAPNDRFQLTPSQRATV